MPLAPALFCSFSSHISELNPRWLPQLSVPCGHGGSENELGAFHLNMNKWGAKRSSPFSEHWKTLFA